MSQALKTFKARDFLQYSPADLANAYGRVKLLFDDGQVREADHRHIRFSRHAWEIQKKFKTPITPRHLMQTWMASDGLYTKSTHLSLVAACMFDTLHYYNPQELERDKLLHDLTKMSYEVMGEIYNTYTVAGLPYIRDISIRDFTQLYHYPPFYETVCAVARDIPELIQQYARLKEIVLKDPLIGHLKLASHARAGLVKLDQLLQCFLRGMPTDIDSQTFLRHIDTGYYQGIRRFIPGLTESRSAPKALIYTTTPLQTSEFWNRRSQFLGIRGRRLRHCDCGSTSYFTHLMRPKREVDGEIFRSDVEAFQGTYYLNEETGKVQPILPTDKHLEGKMLKLRSVLAGCELLEKDAVCAVCYGAQADAIFKEQAPGYMVTIVICGNVGQRTMGVKHLDGGASAIKGVNLTTVGSKYLTAPAGGFSYFLKKELSKSTSLFLACETAAAAGVPHISAEIDPSTLDCTTISSLETMDIIIEQAGKNRIITETLDVTSGRRRTSFSPEFLKYIRQNDRVRIEGGRRLVFDMSEWDYSQPLLTLPMRHFNVADHQSLVSKLIEATTRDSIKRAQTLLPTTLCLRLLEALNSHADITWPTAAMMIYTTLNVDVRRGDVTLPRTWTGAQVGSHRRSVANGSLGVGLSFQGHTAIMRSPLTFLNKSHGRKPRPDMLDYDVMFDPEGVFETYPHLYPPQTAEEIESIKLGGFVIPE